MLYNNLVAGSPAESCRVYGDKDSAQSNGGWEGQTSVFTQFFCQSSLQTCQSSFSASFFSLLFFLRVNVVALCLPGTHPVDVARRSLRYLCQLA